MYYSLKAIHPSSFMEIQHFSCSLKITAAVLFFTRNCTLQLLLLENIIVALNCTTILLFQYENFIGNNNQCSQKVFNKTVTKLLSNYYK